jgi:hypothetical protein
MASSFLSKSSPDYCGVFSTFHFVKGPIYWLNIFYINLMLVISTVSLYPDVDQVHNPISATGNFILYQCNDPWIGNGIVSK